MRLLNCGAALSVRLRMRTELRACPTPEDILPRFSLFLRPSQSPDSRYRPPSRKVALYADVDRPIGRVAKILDPMLERRIPSRFARLRKHFAYFSALVGKTKMSFRDAHHHAARMIMQPRLLVRPVGDRNDLHPVIFKVQFVVLGLDLGGILRLRGHGRQTQKCSRPE